MKKFLIALAVIALSLVAAYGGYRYIMINLRPYVAEDGTVYIEIFGQVDEYDAAPAYELFAE